MVVQVFESIWSFESISGVRISTVRIVPTRLFKMVTPLSPHRSSLRNEIVNQSELYLYSPLKKAAAVYANQNGDRPPQSGWENILLLQCPVPRPTRYYNLIYDPVGFACGIFDRYYTLYISILGFWGYWTKKSLRSLVVQVGWGLCHYRSLAAKPRCRRGISARIINTATRSPPPPPPQGIPIGRRWIYVGRFTDGDSRRGGGVVDC